MKSVQSGISEIAIIKIMDEMERGRSVFYALPTYDLKNRFVQNRFDMSVKFTKYYQNLKNESSLSHESMSLKNYGTGVTAFVGSNTPVPFTEFPADTFVVDEKDRCDQKNLLMGEERLGHADSPRRIYISNPTIEDFGIHEDFKISTKAEWFVRCSNCGKFIQPNFFTHIVRQTDDNDYIILDKDWDYETVSDVRPVCEYCHRPFDRYADGEWVDYVRSRIFGAHINQIFSSNVRLDEQALSFGKALLNPTKMERFYNSVLGLPYSAEGSKVTADLINSCLGDYAFDLKRGGISSFNEKKDFCFMGVDVGTKLHVVVGKYLENNITQMIYINELNHLKDLLVIAKRFKVKFAVIDAGPERRLSTAFTLFSKTFYMCYYSRVKRLMIDKQSKSISVDRTESLDAILEVLLSKKIFFPKNISSVKNFIDQMCSSTRVYDESSERYIWRESKADHYFHAINYMFLARKMMLAILNRKR